MRKGACRVALEKTGGRFVSQIQSATDRRFVLPNRMTPVEWGTNDLEPGIPEIKKESGSRAWRRLRRSDRRSRARLVVKNQHGCGYGKGSDFRGAQGIERRGKGNRNLSLGGTEVHQFEGLADRNRVAAAILNTDAEVTV